MAPAVSSNSRAYAIGIHSLGIKKDSIKSSHSWVEEHASKKTWNSRTAVTKAIVIKSEQNFAKNKLEQIVS